MAESDFGENESEISQTKKFPKLSRNLVLESSGADFCLIQTMILVVRMGIFLDTLNNQIKIWNIFYQNIEVFSEENFSYNSSG